MEFISNKLKINYEKRGIGKPVILLHGWGSNLNSFNNIASVMETKYQVYLIDLPGFGSSEVPTKPYSLDEYVQMLEQFVKENEIVKPIIIGHSFGGRIGIRYSINNEISKLILIDSAGIRRFSLKVKVKILNYKIKKWYYNKTNNISKLEKLQDSSGSIDYQNASPIMKQTLSLIVNENQKKELSKVKCETLIMWGKNDKVTPYKDAKLMNLRIKNSGLVTFDSSGHFPYIEEEYEFIEVLKHYLQIGDN